MKAELIPTEGGAPIPITRDVSVVGRREYCDIRIDHPSLSKRHCVLVKTDGLLVIRDLATTNGTKVKGQKIRWAALLPEDRISFGSVKFRVYLGPDDVPSPSEAGYRGVSKPIESSVGFATPTPDPDARAPRQPRKPEPRPRPGPRPEVDLPPVNLDEAAWRDALTSGIELIEGDEIIELD